MIYFRYLLELLMIFPAAFIALRPVRYYAKFPRITIYSVIAIVLTLFCLCGAWVCEKARISSEYIIYPAMIPLLIVYCFSYDLSLGKKLFCFFNSSMLCAFSTMYTVYITAPIERTKTEDLFFPESSLICLGVNILNGILFYRTLKTKIPYLLQNTYIEKIWMPLSVVPFGATILFVYCCPISPENVMIGRLRPLAMLFFAIILIIMLLLYHIMWWCARQITHNADLEETNNNLLMEEKRYEELRAYIDHTRTLRHDFRQHIILLQHYLNTGDLETLRTSLNEFDSALNATRTAYCENRAIDAIVAHYMRVAQRKGINIKLQMNLPEQIPMKMTDLCVVLGNLMENAMHGVETLDPEKRQVELRAKMLTDEMIGITISNPYDATLILDRNGIPKSQRKHHGIGLRSVVDTVKHYQGNVQFKTENRIFQVSLTMTCKYEESEPS